MDDSRSAGKALITADEMAFLDSWKCPDYLWAPADQGAKRGFQEALISRHGDNYIIAWRKALDKDSSMRVNFPEFTQTCKRLARQGVPHAIPASGISSLYCAFDPCRRGWFTLRDWHERSYTVLVAFRRWAMDEFTKVSDCFKHWDATGVGLGKFRAFTKTLDLTCDEKEYLFEGLSLEAEHWSEEKGRYAHGTLTRAQVHFLDTWDPDEEQAESDSWCDALRSPSPEDFSRDHHSRDHSRHHTIA